ncbi:MULTISPECIES: hypothetical protein [Streptomyces]|uniref:hypothetical protein n=1 Tax=Streptomyces TaxID=1883 RepID=UPI0023DD6228|nr:hypothetical protein [Streptomyces sp. FXJ1.172]WEP00857.1 hypothetical protein A6P39_042590 [Streptomyces sp. FXJ1.172]
MASTRYTHVWNVKQRHSAPGRVAAVSGGRPSRDTAHLAERGWPTDTQMWNWAESVVLSGNGPSASSFL